MQDIAHLAMGAGKCRLRVVRIIWLSRGVVVDSRNSRDPLPPASSIVPAGGNGREVNEGSALPLLKSQ